MNAKAGPKSKPTGECCGCILESLLVCKFTSCQFPQKLEIISIGRPTPALPNLSCQTKKINRQFDESQYTLTPWLCGCKKTNRLYCWPCVLFSTDNGIWSEQGINDLTNITNLLKKHSLSKCHLRNAISLVKLSSAKVDNQLRDFSKENIGKYNELVKNNRHVIDRLIDTICYLTEQEQPVVEMFEEDESVSLRKHEQLINLLSKTDPVLCYHLNSSNNFRVTSNDLRRDLIESIAETITSEIKKEIKEAKFISLILGGNVDDTSQFSTVLRYVSSQGVQERFIRFSPVSKDRPAHSIANHVIMLIKEFQSAEKLIAQSYDGAIIIKDGHTGLEELIKVNFKDAQYVNYYAYEFSLVLNQALNSIKECNSFFHTLSGFQRFFSVSPKRALLLDQIAKKSFPSVPATSWKYNSGIIEVIMNVKEELLEVFKTIYENVEEWDLDTRSCAKGYYDTLKEIQFNFLLNLFWSLFEKFEVFCIIMKRNIYDIDYCQKKIGEFQDILTEFRNNFDGLWPTAPSSGEPLLPVPQKRKKKLQEEELNGNEKKSIYQKLFYDIIDTVFVHVAIRYTNIDCLKFLTLLDFERFEEFSELFPEDLLNSLVKYYGKNFDYLFLKHELTEVYASPDFRKNNVLQLYSYLESSGLAEVLPETTKLCALVLTIPAINPLKEKSTTAYERINTFLVNAKQNVFSGLSLISIEKELFQYLKSKPTFYDKVREIFSLKNQHIELTYK